MDGSFLFFWVVCICCRVNFVVDWVVRVVFFLLLSFFNLRFCEKRKIICDGDWEYNCVRGGFIVKE